MTATIIVEFVDLWARLQDIVLLPQQEDKIVWLHTSDGQYTTKSAYEVQFIGSTTSLTAETTWRTKAPPKCRFFTWLMLQNRIWTAARLQLRGWPNDYFCQLCIRNLETTAHLFLECYFLKAIWDKVSSSIMVMDLKPANWEHICDLE
jgi:hypothetical protein